MNSNLFLTLKKSMRMVWHSHNFLPPYITTEYFFIIIIIIIRLFMLTLFFHAFQLNEFPALVFAVENFSS